MDTHTHDLSSTGRSVRGAVMSRRSSVCSSGRRREGDVTRVPSLPGRGDRPGRHVQVRIGDVAVARCETGG